MPLFLLRYSAFALATSAAAISQLPSAPAESAAAADLLARKEITFSRYVSERSGRALPAASAARLDQAYADYTAARISFDGRVTAELEAAAARLNRLLADVDLRSSVTFETPTPGARVRYQVVGETEVKALGPLTNIVSEPVRIGYYYFWSERRGRRTSERLYVEIDNPTERVEFEER